MKGKGNMKFRPCIDIHNGQVKQIVGGSLRDLGDQARENFVATQDAVFFAKLYQKYNLKGGHIILLNGKDSSYYEATKAQAMAALKAYPGGMQIGGGINDENANEYLECGADKVIVTSYVFKDGKISYENLEKLVKAVGKEKLVLFLSFLFCPRINLPIPVPAPSHVRDNSSTIGLTVQKASASSLYFFRSFELLGTF